MPFHSAQPLFQPPKTLKSNNMKIKNKGKVHPSPSSTITIDPLLSTLQLLPSTILSLASILPPHDLQVLSYLLARSLRLSNGTHSSSSSSHGSGSSSSDCDCFNCYTFYWLRWDSSPNRDLIHRVIDAFEDHLSSSPTSSSSSATIKSKVGRRRGKDRNGSRDKHERSDIGSRGDVGCSGAPDTRDVMVTKDGERNNDDDDDAMVIAAEVTTPGSADPVYPTPAPKMIPGGGEHKGLARKVLPDVLGILNSRLWNLWSPDV